MVTVTTIDQFQLIFGWAPASPGLAHSVAIAEYERLLTVFEEAKNHIPIVQQAALALGQYTQLSQQYFDHMSAPEQLDLFGVARTPQLDLPLLKFLSAQIHKYADQYRANWSALVRLTQQPGGEEPSEEDNEARMRLARIRGGR